VSRPSAVERRTKDPATRKGAGRVNRRKQIIQAAEKLILSQGLACVTTRQISQEVGCSDGALYVHFKGRLELLLAVLEEGLPEMLGPLHTLQERVGQGSPQENLHAALQGIFRFHTRVTPIVASLFAEPELHAAYRKSLARRNQGPHLSLEVLEGYLAAEQKLGRIDQHINPRVAAHILMSASFFRAFSELFFGRKMRPAWGPFSKQLVTIVAPGQRIS
jgi:AcrR family transcriptional regulator